MGDEKFSLLPDTLTMNTSRDALIVAIAYFVGLVPAILAVIGKILLDRGFFD